jgi:hypothetical protein
MRVILFIFFFIHIWFVSDGQSPVYFNKLLSSISGTSAIASAVVSDTNYFLVIDNIAPGQNNQHTMYILVNTHGEIVDSAMYPGLYKHSMVAPGNTALRTNSGKYLVATSRIDTNNFLNPHLFCLDPNLDTLWTRTFTHPDTLAATQPGAYVYNMHTAIRQTWDGGFIITGNYSRNCDQNQMRSYLLKTDSMGVMEWIKKYNDVGKLFDIQITYDSGFVFKNGLVGYNITKTNSIGEIQWQVKPNNDGHLAVAAIGLTSDSCVILASPHVYEWVNGNPRFGMDVSKVKLTDQSVLWNKKNNLYLSFECFTLHQNFTLQVLPDDHIVIGGTSRVLDPNISGFPEYKGVMMKLTPDGDSLWARYYGYGSFHHGCQFEHMIPTHDGGFLAVGFYYPMAPSRPWLVKMDSLGCDTPGCHLIGIEERVLSMPELEVFPNPFSEQMHLVLPEGFSGGKLVLFDVQGRRAMETEVPANWGQQNFSLETGHLKPGIYLLELTDRDGRVWRRKAVKK